MIKHFKKFRVKLFREAILDFPTKPFNFLEFLELFDSSL